MRTSPHVSSLTSLRTVKALPASVFTKLTVTIRQNFVKHSGTEFCANRSNSLVSDLFIHLVVCLTTDPKPLPKPALHIVRSRAFSFKWEYPLLSLRSSNSCLRLLRCLPVTSIPPCIFPSVTCCRRQFLHRMWPIQFYVRYCTFALWAFDNEVLDLFPVHAERGNKWRAHGINMNCTVFCGLWRGADGRTAAVRTLCFGASISPCWAVLPR
jgi:hypothetical protein